MLAALLGLGSAEVWAQRVALVIANEAYLHAPRLHNPVADAGLIEQSLKAAGFSVSLHRDLDDDAMEREVARFGAAARDAEIALVYYAGHGLEVDGSNWLLPVDARIEDELMLEVEALALDRLLQVTAQARNRVLIVDACRENPFPNMRRADGSTRSLSRGGLAKVEVEASRGLPAVGRKAGTLIAYATAPNQLAADGPPGGNSPFAQALARWLATPGLELTSVFTRVRREMLDSGAQEPWVNGSIDPITLLVAGRTPAEPAGVAPIANDLETARALIKDRKYSLAVAPLERAVAAGDAEAMYELVGLLGKPGVEEDKQRNRQLLERAAALGQPDAMLALAFGKLTHDVNGDDEIPHDPVGGRALLAQLSGRSDHWAALAEVMLEGHERLESGQFLQMDADAIRRLETSAIAGNELAASLLLLVYFEVPETRDLQRGYYWAARLADQDDAEGQKYLAQCLLMMECGVATDIDRGWTLLRQSAAQGDTEANSLVGAFLANENRLGVAPDRQLAKRHLRLAAEDGDLFSMFQLAQLAITENDEAEARLRLDEASEGGYPDAQNLRALALIEGRYGYRQDKKAGVALMQQAADAGDASAQGNLADYHYWGDKQELGLPKDHSRARHYYELAAAQGNYVAQVGLGYMHLKGEGGLAKDADKAGALFRQAADAGYAAGQLEYAYHLAYKAKDPVQARRYFELAVAQGSAAALRGLAELYLDGLGVVPDRPRAVELLRSAARQGDEVAKDLLKELGQTSP